ncbi:uncharacterized protein LOC131054610 [Cryptomeria japonica]|uniref:uncharacterized protein LOC131054610 n=1 Tax=Cryptomeria japonica TaxID=3369 RepID=UPI0027DA6256|nr:uncharacterized protein LOC131054610 [Cryptomeria japonica]
MIEDLSSKAGNSRNQPLLTKEHVSRKFGEVAGGCAAECAAVVCCPCALLNLAALAFVKLPAGLCRKAWRKVKRKRRKKSKAVQGKDIADEDSDMQDSSGSSSQDELLTPRYSTNAMVTEQTCVSTEKVWEEVVGKSYVGFWRNLSNREQTS